MQVKNTNISERISLMIDLLGVTKNEFAQKMGYNRSQAIYDITNGKSKPSYDFFDKLLNSEYSEFINIDSLITGKGEFIKTKDKVNVINSNDNNNDNFFNNKPNVKDLVSNENLRLIIDEQKNIISKLKEQIEFYKFKDSYNGLGVDERLKKVEDFMDLMKMVMKIDVEISNINTEKGKPLINKKTP
ncbi:hypothetical protein BWK59_12750 [Flavobacterium davisii]|uniref:HTH cro/C1-type domain-containing protein n=1 Tax=Flavobacterium davisii TaxID=2906077 RepID=A0A246GFU2_9FLAO|nr:helix-turn-helix transcriptional regulator [Flavobacterium davisii]OWP83021.1 hypothetical protein BWK59_12750 [Flavobacterium davisii]